MESIPSKYDPSWVAYPALSAAAYRVLGKRRPIFWRAPRPKKRGTLSTFTPVVRVGSVPLFSAADFSVADFFSAGDD
jgi:hypothetical protein